MKLITKHKFTVFVIIVYIIIVVFAFFINQTFFSNKNMPKWGDRLDGIEDVAIGSEQYVTMKLELEKNEKVEKVTYNLSGKTVNVVITVGEKVSKADAKKIGDTILKYFDDSQKAFYDFQVFVKKENVKLNDFPIIGYKHKTSTKIVWSKDRQVSEE